jgi:predicted RNase H-like nuclease (RuvC/YqgF family)
VLESIIQRKDAEIVAYIENLAKTDRHIEVMREEILTLNIKLQETTRRIEAIIEQRSESDAARDEIIEELMTTNEELGTEIAEHNERIRTLTSELKRLDDATEGLTIQWPLTHGCKMHRETGKQSVDPIIDRQI